MPKCGMDVKKNPLYWSVCNKKSSFWSLALEENIKIRKATVRLTIYNGSGSEVSIFHIANRESS